MKLTNHFIKSTIGNFYLVDKGELQEKSIFITHNEQEVAYRLTDGIISPNLQYNNHRIKFDFLGDADYYGWTCSGFLYPDYKFIGKIRYRAESNLLPENIRGVYRATKSRIVIHGEWEGLNGDKLYYWLELAGLKRLQLNTLISG